MPDHPRLLVTGASGQLGRLVIDALLRRGVPAGRIVAMVRDPAAGAAFAAKGVEVRTGDYAAPATLDEAVAGVDRVLLISSNALGQRVSQHGHVIDAARRAGVGLLAYTSVLHADRSTLGLAEEHRQTEALLAASGLPAVLLRNGWYTENHTGALAPVLAHGTLMGGAGRGRFSSAARADYAEAAAVVLTGSDQGGRIHELAGDAAYTYADLAAEIARQAGKPVAYADLPEGEYRAALVGVGLPAPLAALIADSDVAAAGGALFDDGHALSALIGRPTTPMSQTVAAALRALAA